ncbi:MAG: hypothetical protein OXC63_04570 [Aestuariivita sp.]|nr:hypothetical protein [Aestuariivita sp.]MCY4345298.1 hypothetical protein [Aestuariivita sp.]
MEKTTPSLCWSAIGQTSDAPNGSTACKAYPAGVDELSDLKSRDAIATAFGGHLPTLRPRVAEHPATSFANRSKINAPLKSGAKEFAPYIPALKDGVLRRDG